VTEFGSFDNSTCKRVLDLLEPGDLTLGQAVIKRVANTKQRRTVRKDALIITNSFTQSK